MDGDMDSVENNCQYVRYLVKSNFLLVLSTNGHFAVGLYPDV